MNNKIKVSLKNIVQVFFSVNNIKDRSETDELKQMIIEEMIEKGGLPVWDRDKNDCRVRVSHLIKFGDIVEL